MVVFLVSEILKIKSHKGEYFVKFNKEGIAELNNSPIANAVFIIDKNIAELYKSKIQNVLDTKRVILIEAIEENKSLENKVEILN